MSLNVNAQAAHRRAIARTGITVIFTRRTGVAPSVTEITATVTAVVRHYTPQAGIGNSGHAPKISEGDRIVIVVADDLAAQSFPLPVVKNDKITLPDGSMLNVTEADPYFRDMAGAIEIKAEGVR